MRRPSRCRYFLAAAFFSLARFSMIRSFLTARLARVRTCLRPGYAPIGGRSCAVWLKTARKDRFQAIRSSCASMGSIHPARDLVGQTGQDLRRRSVMTRIESHLIHIPSGLQIHQDRIGWRMTEHPVCRQNFSGGPQDDNGVHRSQFAHEIVKHIVVWCRLAKENNTGLHCFLAMTNRTARLIVSRSLKFPFQVALDAMHELRFAM